MSLFDFLRPRRAPRPGGSGDDVTWQVRADGELLLIESSRGDTVFHARVGSARAVRVVPLSRGSHHLSATGWQVTLERGDGDVLLGPPLASWQSARDLASRVCGATHLPMDELTERLFSRVGGVDL
jgi:hypothetical protein